MKKILTYEEVCALLLERHEQSGETWRALGEKSGYIWNTCQRYLKGERIDNQGPALEDIGAALGLNIKQLYIVEDMKK